LWLPDLADAIRDTLWTVGASALVAALVGEPLAHVLVTTAPGGLYERRGVYAALGAIVNACGSTPFVMLLVALLPLRLFVCVTTFG
ncbi:ABC transporter permease, partial [Burkholderia pseudomallei]